MSHSSLRVEKDLTHSYLYLYSGKRIAMSKKLFNNAAYRELFPFV